MRCVVVLLVCITVVISNPLPAEPTKTLSEAGQSILDTKIYAILKNSLGFINSSIKEMVKTDEFLILWKNISMGASSFLLIAFFLVMVHWHRKSNTKLSKLKQKIKEMRNNTL